MASENTGIVIDLFTQPMSERRPRRDTAPERGPAPVINIFSAKASDRRFFDRIKDILAARLAKGRLFVELYVDGPALPDNYLRSLTCTVDDPLAGIHAVVRIEAVKAKGHYVGLRSEPLQGAPQGAASLNPDAVIRITSPSGQLLQNFLLPLLEAKP